MNALSASLKIEEARCATVPQVLDFLKEKLSQFDVISLDCFDTLVHRFHQNPCDHFAYLPLFRNEKNNRFYHHSHFRIQAEHQARGKMFIERQQHEVCLTDIYQTLLPESNLETCLHHANQELAVDIQYAYFNLAWLSLFQFARAHGKKLILVSDTYYTKAQIILFLNSLQLETSANEIFSEIFVSSEFGISKSEGLLKTVTKQLNMNPNRIVHIGDHPISDFLSAKKNQIHAILWKGFSEIHTQVFRAEKSIHTMLGLELNHPFKQAYKAVHQLKNPDEISPIESIARLSLAPLLFLFDQYVYQQYQVAKSKHSSTKLVFLLRDGYLSEQIYTQLHPEESVLSASISRSTSIACSFFDRQDILGYLQALGFSDEIDLLLKQFLFLDLEIQLFRNQKKNGDPKVHLIQFLKENEGKILSRSKKMRAGLHAYFSRLGIQSGDHLVFVDLGYTGTTHFKLKKFMHELGVTYESVFLLSLNGIKSSESISGWIDGRCHDRLIMDLLVTYIGLLEKLCSCFTGSVIHYDESGVPILKDSQYSENQIKITENIQRDVLAYVKDLKAAMVFLSESESAACGMVYLSRLLFMPTESEIQILSSFLFDMNLKTDRHFSLFNIQSGLDGLNKRGMNYIEKNLKNIKMNLPIELRAIQLELSFFLVMQHRLGLEFSANDFSYLKQTLTVLIIDGDRSAQFQVEAKSTFNDYYALILPVLSGNEQFGIIFPFSGSLLEMYAIETFEGRYYLTNQESVFTHAVQYQKACSNLKEISQNIYFCESSDAIFSMKPSNTKSGDQIRVCFRVIPLHSSGEVL